MAFQSNARFIGAVMDRGMVAKRLMMETSLL